MGTDSISVASLAHYIASQVSTKSLVPSTNFSAALSSPILNQFHPLNFALPSSYINSKVCKLNGENRTFTSGEINKWKSCHTFIHLSPLQNQSYLSNHWANFIRSSYSPLPYLLTVCFASYNSLIGPRGEEISFFKALPFSFSGIFPATNTIYLDFSIGSKLWFSLDHFFLLSHTDFGGTRGAKLFLGISRWSLPKLLLQLFPGI